MQLWRPYRLTNHQQCGVEKNRKMNKVIKQQDGTSSLAPFENWFSSIRIVRNSNINVNNISGLRTKKFLGIPGSGRPLRGSWEFSKFFEKNFDIKMKKCIILAHSLKKVKTPALHFRARGRKTQLVWNFLRKL